MINIYLADDHAVLNLSLSQLLNADECFNVVGTATTGDEAIKGIIRHKPDLALIDYSLPDCNGITVIKDCLSNDINCQYALLTMH